MLYYQILSKSMKEILEKNDSLKPPKIGEIVQGKIVSKGKASVFLDLGKWGTGIIYGREFYEAKDRLKGLKIGDSIFVKIVDFENEEGYIEVSLSKAGRELAWEELKQKKEKDEILSVKISGANKGGLLTKISSIPAFLPVSQLSPTNYPKVEGGENQKILRALQKFIGKEMEVKIFDLDPKEEKLILSEKAKEASKIKEILKNYKVGDVIEAEITGVVDFGAFIKFPASPDSQASRGGGPESLEGLIHISELDWQLIEDPSQIVKMGQKIKAKIIEISNDKVFLSLKALKKDPWEGIEEIYKKKDIIKGKITKLNPFGAFVQISPARNVSPSDAGGPGPDDSDIKKDKPKIQGLCHISEFGSQKKMEQTLKTGKEYSFEILSIDPPKHRMSLRLAKEE